MTVAPKGICKVDLKYLYNHFKEFHNTHRLYKTMASNVGSGGSADWMTRHINDPHVKMSRYKNYRARSAFKLIEIDDKFKLLKPGHRIVDCGAAPGSWTQVAVERVNANGKDTNKPKGMVIGVDIIPISSIPGAVLLSGCDFTNPETMDKIFSLLGGAKVDVVLSDMCPNISGAYQIDSDRITDLTFHALRFAIATLTPGGHVLIKGFDEMKGEAFSEAMLKFFESLKRLKPNASRGDSSEMFYLGLRFKGVRNKDDSS